MNLVEERLKRPSGQITFILHEGGELVGDELVGGKLLNRTIIQNLIVDKASELMAARMAPGAVTGSTTPSFTGNFLNSGLQYISVGVGILQNTALPYDEKTNDVDTTQWDLQNPPTEQLTVTKLVGELYRKQFTSWCFVDAAGNETSTLTNILKLSTTFYENEANGPLTEMGLFGGDAQDWNNGAGKDSGYMFNYKTFKVWNKPNTARLSIVWKLTY